MEIRLKGLDSIPITTIDFSTADWHEYTVSCDSMLIGAYDIYFVFKGVDGNMAFDTWQFTTKAEGTGIRQTDATDRIPMRYEYYTIDGIRLKKKPDSGIVICRTYYSDGSIKTKTEIAK